MIPTKGKGERYIHCPHDGGECLDLVIKKGWSAFNCGQCEVYLQSDTYAEKMLKKKKMDSRLHGNDGCENKNEEIRSSYMADKKNQLIDLNDSLFAQMDRLTSEELDEKGLQKEILRSKAVSNLAAQIIQNAKLALEGSKAMKAGLVDGDNLMLGRGDDSK